MMEIFSEIHQQPEVLQNMIGQYAWPTIEGYRDSANITRGRIEEQQQILDDTVREYWRFLIEEPGTRPLLEAPLIFKPTDSLESIRLYMEREVVPFLSRLIDLITIIGIKPIEEPAKWEYVSTEVKDIRPWYPHEETYERLQDYVENLVRPQTPSLGAVYVRYRLIEEVKEDEDVYLFPQEEELIGPIYDSRALSQVFEARFQP